MFRHMLVCYDGSASAKKALHTAVTLAAEQGSALCCLSVEEKLPTYAGTIDEFDEVKKERDAYYAGVQADAQRIAAEHGLERLWRPVTRPRRSCGWRTRAATTW